MDRFKVNQDKMAVIAKAFGIKQSSVELMNTKYQEISRGIKYQYLAHAIRTVESEIRKRQGHGGRCFFPPVARPL